MLKDTFLDAIKGISPRPNKFTVGMGKLIKFAREEAGLSQRELAGQISRRQAALSDMENGKMEPDASTLSVLAYILNKPLSYFFPEPWKLNNSLDQLSEKEQEILIQIRRLPEEDLNKLLIQIKALTEIYGK